MPERGQEKRLDVEPQAAALLLACCMWEVHAPRMYGTVEQESFGDAEMGRGRGTWSPSRDAPDPTRWPNFPFEQKKSLIHRLEKVAGRAKAPSAANHSSLLSGHNLNDKTTDRRFQISCNVGWKEGIGTGNWNWEGTSTPNPQVRPEAREKGKKQSRWAVRLAGAPVRVAQPN